MAQRAPACTCCPLLDLVGTAARRPAPRQQWQQRIGPQPRPAAAAAAPTAATSSGGPPPGSLELWALVPGLGVWDGIAERPQPGTALLIRGERVTAVVPATQVRGISRVVEAANCTAIPGLIDAHVHISAAMGPAFLAAGVTTIRDTGNQLGWILERRRAHAADPAVGPTILCCGHALDYSDPPPPLWNYMVREHSTADELAASVEEHVAAGVDQIKLYARLDKEMLAVGAGAAKRHSKFVLAHLGGQAQVGGAFGLADFTDAAAAGVDEFEHLVGLDTAWREAEDSEIEAEVEALFRTGLILDPTLLVWQRYSGILDNALRHDERRRWVHPGLLGTWAGFNWNTLDETFHASRRRLRLAMAPLQRFLKVAHARGVTVALGTDTPFPHEIPGFAVHDELALYVDAGLRPVDALKCATATNARVLGIEADVGTLGEGMIADISVVRGDPTTDIFAVGRVECVVHRGQLMRPAGLFEDAQQLFAVPDDDPVSVDLRGRVVDPAKL